MSVLSFGPQLGQAQVQLVVFRSHLRGVPLGGAVLEAAQAGDVLKLQAALDDGGSIDEADTVRCNVGKRKACCQGGCTDLPMRLPRFFHPLLR